MTVVRGKHPFDDLVPNDPLFEQPRLQKLVGKPKPVRESAVEKCLVDRVKALGGECRKVQWIGRVGAPDRLVMLPPGHAMGTLQNLPTRTVWCEMKRPKKDAEEHQAREHKRMREMGQQVLVIDSKALVDLHFPLP
jgi:hypothetical protein